MANAAMRHATNHACTKYTPARGERRRSASPLDTGKRGHQLLDARADEGDRHFLIVTEVAHGQNRPPPACGAGPGPSSAVEPRGPAAPRPAGGGGGGGGGGGTSQRVALVCGGA